MDAREIESLSMLQRGFAELKDANPQLAYNVILDILQGVNEYVVSLVFPSEILAYLLNYFQQFFCKATCSDIAWFISS